MKMADNLDNEFINIEFRILLAEESIKKVHKKTTALLSEIQDWKQKYATASDEDDYWTAD
jgi:hypothetical protein